jgi:hypothetical protein
LVLDSVTSAPRMLEEKEMEKTNEIYKIITRRPKEYITT